MAESYVAQNMAHKRTYDDIGPEDGPGPSGSRRESLGSSSAASGSRERNKRARNDTADSAYASEVDDLLISSNTSDVSSSTSSHSSYHSARSTFTAASPALLPVDEDADNEHSLPELLSSLSPETSIDVSMDDDLPFPRPASIAPAPTPPQPERPDSGEQLRRTLERAGAFEREIAALRHSPPGTQSPVWQPWSTQMPTSSDEPPFSYGSAFDLPPRLPSPRETLNTDIHDISAPHPLTGRDSPPAFVDPLYSPHVTFPSTDSELEPREEPLRLGGYRQVDYDHMLAVELEGIRSSYSTFRHSESPRLTERRRSHAPTAPASSIRPSPSSAIPTATDGPWWRRDHSRDVRSIDRTLRDVHEHRQRVAQLLADTESTSRPSPVSARRPAVAVAAASASSSYSTLRGALDDTAIRSRPPVSSSTLHRRTSARAAREEHLDRPRAELPDLADSMFDTPGGMMMFDEFMRSGVRRTSTHDDALDLSPLPLPSDLSVPQHEMFATNPYDAAYPQSSLEANRRARSYGISGLRYRARARSPSPPSPPMSTYLDIYNGGRADTTSLSSRASGNNPSDRASNWFSAGQHTSTPRSPWGDPPQAQSQSQTYGVHWHRPPSPPSALPPSAAAPRARQYRNGTIDLDAYHDGPFRATLARSVALQSQSQNPRGHTEPERVSAPERRSADISPMDSLSEEDSDEDLLSRYITTYRPRHYSPILGRNQPRSITPSLSTYSRQFEAFPGARRQDVSNAERQFFDAAFRQDTSNAETGIFPRYRREDVSNAETGSLIGSTRSDPTREPESQSPAERLLDLIGRSVAAPSSVGSGTGPSMVNNSSYRSRTLLSRERSLSNLRENLHLDRLDRAVRPNEASAVSTAARPLSEQLRLARRRATQTQRELDRELLASRPYGYPVPVPLPEVTPRGSPSNLSSSANSSSAAPNIGIGPRPGPGVREVGGNGSAVPRSSHPHPHTPPHPLPRRHWHPLNSLTTLTSRAEARGEERGGPLNGRFGRARLPNMPPDMVFVDVTANRLPHLRRRHPGDYMRDDEFDMSYEGLLSLSTLLGDVKPRGTPADVVSSLPKGTYGEWKKPTETEERCPICLDDYTATDSCLRIPACSHWFHEGCLQQWLENARTCPVCRGRVSKPRSAGASTSESSAPVAGPSGSGPNITITAVPNTTTTTTTTADARNNRRANPNGRRNPNNNPNPLINPNGGPDRFRNTNYLNSFDRPLRFEIDDDDLNDESDEDIDVLPSQTRHWSPYRPPWRSDFE